MEGHRDNHETFQPTVKPQNLFKEITLDFGNPLEVFREAISNSVDHNASVLRISCNVERVDGERTLVIELEDDGDLPPKVVPQLM